MGTVAIYVAGFTGDEGNRLGIAGASGSAEKTKKEPGQAKNGAIFAGSLRKDGDDRIEQRRARARQEASRALKEQFDRDNEITDRQDELRGRNKEIKGEIADIRDQVKGIRACVCSEPYSARLSRQHNNTNVLAFGARVVGSEMAKMIVDEWLGAKFEGGRHARRVGQIMEIENEGSV